ncbi:MAG TPA: hypothetical protein VEW25_08320 [Allosphingosinicella sp.]|nr:hypothetical protein [Allosphingosinicella sp.]
MLSTGRTLLGGIVAGIILFVVGFIFWATPLAEFAYKTAGDQQGAAVQLALAQNLSPSGTGAYIIPAHESAGGAVLYAQGPIATVHFNTSGYSPDDMSMILPGFIMALISGMLISLGLGAVCGGGRSFAAAAKLVICFSVGVTLWTILAQPIFNHFGWGYWIYSFIAETTGLVLAGLVVARWFVPHPRAAHADAPVEV